MARALGQAHAGRMGNDDRKWPEWEQLTEADYGEIGRRIHRELLHIIAMKREAAAERLRRQQDRRQQDVSDHQQQHEPDRKTADHD